MIISYRGNQRSGKTFRMTLDALRISALHDTPIYSNYPIFVGNVFTYRDLTELFSIRNSIIIVDEINTALDSRNYEKKAVIDFTHFFQQMGKLGNTFLYSAQRIHTVEKRIRDNTDYVYECARLWPSSTLQFDLYDARRDALNPVWIKREYLLLPEKYYFVYDSFAVVSTAKE